MVNNWIEADNALLRIGRIERDIKAEELLFNDSIEQIKKTAEEIISPLQADRKALEAELKAFVTRNAKDLGEARSKKLNFGTIGFKNFRTEISWTKGQTQDGVVALLIKAGYDQCVQTKQKVLKDVVKSLQLAEAKLAKLGMVLKQKKNQFFYQIDQEKIEEKPA